MGFSNSRYPTLLLQMPIRGDIKPFVLNSFNCSAQIFAIYEFWTKFGLVYALGMAWIVYIRQPCRKANCEGI